MNYQKVLLSLAACLTLPTLSFAQTPEFTKRGTGLLQVYGVSYVYKQLGDPEINPSLSDRCGEELLTKTPAESDLITSCKASVLETVNETLRSNPAYMAYTKKASISFNC